MYKKITLIVLTLVMLMYSIPAQAVSFNLSGDDSEESGTVESSEVDTYSNDEYGISLLSDATVVDSGYCGATGNEENITWTLYDSGLLEITGTGAMADYWGSRTSPWYSYRADIKNLSIAEGVTCIGTYAFYNCNQIYCEISIPESVTSIKNDAFYNCSNAKFKIPNTVKNIGSEAFLWCSNITGELTLPSELETLGTYAFRGTKIEGTLTIPSKVKSIGWGIIDSTGVDNIKVAEENTNYKDIDGVLFTKDGKTLVRFPARKVLDTCYEIPYGTEILSTECFDSCSFKNGGVIIPDTVVSINSGAFYGCTLNGSLNIPSSVNRIGSSAFSCWGLKDLRIEKPNGSLDISGTGLTYIRGLVIHWNTAPGATCTVEITVPKMEWTGSEVEPLPTVTDK